MATVAASTVERTSPFTVTADYVNAYTYDNLGRVTRVTQSGVALGHAVAPKRVDLVYNDRGQLDEVLRYADLDGTKVVAETDLDYDELGHVTDIVHARLNQVFADYYLAWDKLGQLASFSITNPAGDDGYGIYTYDDTGQLTGADYGGFSSLTDESYTYDANGNRTLVNEEAEYATGDQNRLLSDGTYRYEYDNEGNRTLRYVDADESESLTTGDTEVTEYAWDHRNRLVSVTDYAEYDDLLGECPLFIVEYVYDSFNQLIGRTYDMNGGGSGDTREAFVHNGGQIVLHYQGEDLGTLSDGALAHRYLWGPATDQLLADETVDNAGGDDETPGTADDVLWALTDHQGSVRDLVRYDENGTPTNTADDTVSVEKHVVYDAYGNVTSDTAPSVESLFLYTARPFDAATGLQNNLNRWYDPAVGRWLSVDPIGFWGGDANLYRYCNNSPGNLVDPSGNVAPVIIIVAAFLGFVGTATVANAPGQDDAILPGDQGEGLVNGVHAALTAYFVCRLAEGLWNLGEGLISGNPPPSDPGFDPGEVDLNPRLPSAEQAAFDEFTDTMRVPIDHIEPGKFPAPDEYWPKPPEPPLDDGYDGWIPPEDRYRG